MPGLYATAEGGDLFMPASESWAFGYDGKSCTTGRDGPKSLCSLSGLRSRDSLHSCPGGKDEEGQEGG